MRDLRLYNNYIKFIDTLEKGQHEKTKDFYKRTKNFLSDYNRVLFKKLNLYTFDRKNGYNYKRISEAEFLRLMSEYRNKKIIYVFNQENELIYESSNLTEISKKFKTSTACIKNRISKPRLSSKDYYYSYDKDFVISPVKVKRIMNDEWLSSMREGQNKYKERTELKVKKIAEELKANQSLLTKKTSVIANHYKVSERAISTWANKYPFFRSVMDFRKELLNREVFKFKKQLNVKKNDKKIAKEDNINTYYRSNLNLKNSKEVLEYVQERDLKNNVVAKRLGKLGSVENIKNKLKVK